jgi:hypothetical protein
MVSMLAQRDDVELVRDLCEWLVSVYRKDLEVAAIERGATLEQAKTAAVNGSVGLQQMAEGISDRNAAAVTKAIIDAVFQRHYNAGKMHYDKEMAWFADELRKRVKDA